MRVSRLALLALAAAIAMVALSDLTDEWSWLGGLVVSTSLVIWIEFRRGKRRRRIARGVGTLIGLLFPASMVALALVVLVASV